MHPSTTSVERNITVSFAHRIFFTRSVFCPGNRLLADLLSPPASSRAAKVLALIDQEVARAFPNLADDIVVYLAHESNYARLVCPPLVMPGGEAVKNSTDWVDQLHHQVDQHGIDRHSYLIAVGGGALLDAAGFAAATAHRGVRHIRLPTTTLSQADGGVGVKNGINAFGKKNFIGTFAPPFAVINDFDFIRGLTPEVKREGLIEAVKVALIRDAAFFNLIEQVSDNLATFHDLEIEQVVHRCAEMHVQHIAGSGDPFEFGSARPLDFGHWSAHKLEQMSGFTISHGAAVARGVALDVVYSRRQEMLSAASAERALTLIQKLGFSLFDPQMAQADADGHFILLEGLEEFREHLGGELTVTLLREIGCGEEVHDINLPLMRESILELKHRSRTDQP